MSLKYWSLNLRNYFAVPAVISLLLFTACSTERKLALEFVNRPDTVSIMLIPPDYVFKSNLKTWMIEDFDELDTYDQQLLLMDSSKFLRKVEDTILMSRFFNTLESALRKFGFYTYRDHELVEFMSVNNTAYQVALVQVELEEDIYPYRAQEIFFDSVLFYEDFNLEQVSMNCWFEISRLNDPDAVNNVLYAGDYVMDGLEGRFVNNVFTGDVKFKYNYFPMQIEDVYTLAAKLGEKYAGYIFDYMMNRYVYMNFPEGKQPNSYLHFDPETGTFYPAADNRFIFLDE